MFWTFVPCNLSNQSQSLRSRSSQACHRQQRAVMLLSPMQSQGGRGMGRGYGGHLLVTQDTSFIILNYTIENKTVF